jgi:phosphatidylglycerophosphatase A
MTTSVKNPSLIELLKRPDCFLALGFGSGLSPIAPGTMGTLAAIPIYYLLSSLSLTSYLLVTLVALLLGVWLCQRAADWLQKDDPGSVVWDEIVGYLVTMIAAPVGWQWMLIGFVLFRVFDIWKPWPVSVADKKLHGGLGIMLDDVIAGFYAWAVLMLIVAVAN